MAGIRKRNQEEVAKEIASVQEKVVEIKKVIAFTDLIWRLFQNNLLNL